MLHHHFCNQVIYDLGAKHLVCSYDWLLSTPQSSSICNLLYPLSQKVSGEAGMEGWCCLLSRFWQGKISAPEWKGRAVRKGVWGASGEVGEVLGGEVQAAWKCFSTQELKILFGF